MQNLYVNMGDEIHEYKKHDNIVGAIEKFMLFPKCDWSKGEKTNGMTGHKTIGDCQCSAKHVVKELHQIPVIQYYYNIMTKIKQLIACFD